MPTSYTSLLGFALPATGELAGTWGTTVNNSITQLAEDSIAATATASVASGDWTLTTTGGGASNQARCAVLIPTGSPGVSRNIIAPSQSKAYIVINQSNAAVVLKGSATTGTTIAASTKALCAWNGSDFVTIATADVGNLVGTVPVSKGGTGNTTIPARSIFVANALDTLTTVTPTAGQSIRVNAGNTAWEAYTPSSATGDVTAAGNNSFTGANTFYNATGQTFGTATSSQDALILAGRAGGSSSYRITLQPTTLASSTTLSLPNVTDTVATIGTTQTFTAAQTFRAANAVRSEAAATQDAVVIAGRAGGTGSFAITLTPATLSASRTLTLPEPGENVTLGYLNIPQNSQSTAYTLVATDAGKQIFHPSADTTARTYTIPANSSVAYPIGTAITFINQNGAGVITISITTDTMRLAGAGTTGNRTLAANGIATCVKVTSTEWIISGTGLT
jgi:hypothetical protein